MIDAQRLPCRAPAFREPAFRLATNRSRSAGAARLRRRRRCRAGHVGRRPGLARQADPVRGRGARRQLARRARPHDRRPAEGPRSASRSSSRTSPRRAAPSPPRKSRRRRPDGYTMLLGFNGPLAFGPLLSKLPYDVAKDLAPVIITSSQPNVLAVNAQLPVKSVQELVAWAKANPGKLSYASVGNGSSSHLNMELLKSVAGFDARARSVQRLAAGGHGDDPGRDADDVRGDAAAAGADPGGQAARARRHDRQALSAAARPADDRRVRLSRLRGAGVERRDGAGRHAEAGHRAAQCRDQRDPEAAGRRRRRCTRPAST